MTQLVVESVVLAVIGGAGAWVVAKLGVSMLLSTLPVSSVPEQLRFQTDGRMLAFLAGLSFLSAVLFALVPARRATRIDLASALKMTRAMARSRTSRFGHWQVAAQVALSVVLLTAAMLFVRTVRNVTHFDLGFDSHNLIQVELVRDPPIRNAELRGVQERLFAAVAAVPGVESVSVYNAAAFPQYFAGVPHPDGPFGGSVGPDFFKTMRIPLLRGRTFTDDDVTRPQAVAVVNEAYEREILNGEAIGKRIQNGPFNVEVVGVVGNASLHNVRWRDAGLYRVGLRDERFMTALEVRTSADAASVIRSVAQAVQAAVPGWMLSAQTMDDVILRSIARERMVATTSVSFATLGAILAAVGLFGVAAFAVAERTSELGLRIAIGARPRDVIRESLGGTVRLVGIGLVIGTGAAVALANLLGSDLRPALRSHDDRLDQRPGRCGAHDGRRRHRVRRSGAARDADRSAAGDSLGVRAWAASGKGQPRPASGRASGLREAGPRNRASVRPRFKLPRIGRVLSGLARRPTDTALETRRSLLRDFALSLIGPLPVGRQRDHSRACADRAPELTTRALEQRPAGRPLEGPAATPPQRQLRCWLRRLPRARHVAALPDHERATEFDDDVTLLVEAGCLDADDALSGTGFRLARLEDLALRVDRVALEDRVRQLDLVPAEVRDAVDGEIDHRLSGHEREREAGVDEWAFELGVTRVFRVEVDRVGVHREAREPHVVGLRDRPAQRVLVDVADDEVLEHATRPAWFDGH